MAQVSGAVALFVHADLDVDTFLHDVRRSDYLAEIVGGESALDASPLWDLLRVCPGPPTPQAAAEASAQWGPDLSRHVAVIADERCAKGDGSALVLALREGRAADVGH